MCTLQCPCVYGRKEETAPGSQRTLAGSRRADCAYPLLQGLELGCKTWGNRSNTEQRKSEPPIVLPQA